MLFQQSQAFSRRVVELAPELVELEQHAGIVRIEGEGALISGQGSRRLGALVVVGQAEVALNGWKTWVEAGCLLPAGDGLIVAAMRVPKVAQVVGRAGIGRVRLH